MTNPEPLPIIGRIPPDPRKVLHLRVAKLVIDGEPQRAMTDDRAGRIGNEWDWNKAEAITVVAIGDGNFRVIEGQHRTRALQRIDPAASMWCVVLPDEQRGIQREAKLGREISTGRKPYTPLAKWLSNIASGEPHETAAARVLASHGLRVGQSQSSHTIAAVGAMAKIIHGPKNTPATGALLLDRTLTIILGTWPDHDPSSSTTRFDGRLIEAIGLIVTRNPDVDTKRMIAKLGTKRAMRWIEDVLNGSTGSSVRDLVAGSMLISYNTGLRTGHRLQL